MPDFFDIKGILAGLLGLGLLVVGFLYMHERTTAADLRVQLEQQKNAAVTAQNIQLQVATKEAAKAVALGADLSGLATHAAAMASGADASIETHTEKETTLAAQHDDGPAADVLVFVANSLRAQADRIVSAGDDREAGLSAVRDTGGPAGGAAGTGMAWPRTQREFANYALEWGRFSEQCAAHLTAAASNQVEQNARIDKANAP